MAASGHSHSHSHYGRHDPADILWVYVNKGTGLRSADSNGKSDPYCVITCGKQVLKTTIAHKTLYPVWEQSFQFTMIDPKKTTQTPPSWPDNIRIDVMDKDNVVDDFLGQAIIPLDDAEGLTPHDGYAYDLKDKKNAINPKVATGQIFVAMWWEKRAGTSTNTIAPAAAPLGSGAAPSRSSGSSGGTLMPPARSATSSGRSAAPRRRPYDYYDDYYYSDYYDYAPPRRSRRPLPTRQRNGESNSSSNENYSRADVDYYTQQMIARLQLTIRTNYEARLAQAAGVPKGVAPPLGPRPL